MPLLASHDGTPLFDVIKTPSFAVANAPMTFALDAYNSVLAALVAGYVVVDQAGVVEEPDCNNCPAVAVPANIAKAEAVL